MDNSEIIDNITETERENIAEEEIMTEKETDMEKKID